MKSPLHHALLCVATVALLTSLATAFPTPSPYPVSWELAFEHATPKRIVVQPKGARMPQAYWYMTYTVTNRTEDEQMFLPVFEMMTENGQILRSDRNIPPVVLDTIRLREKNPHLQSVNQIGGSLPVGIDQAREGVAIWPEPNPEMGKFTIFVSGLSGEAVMLKDDKGNVIKRKLEGGGEEPVILWKTLQLRYHMPGDDRYPGNDVVEPVDQQWIMR